MTLLYGGFSAFPLGAYTIEEREALDSAGGPDPVAGGSTFPIIDRGSFARYGLKLRRIADGSRAGLEKALSTPGRALAMAGSYKSLPINHPLRKWQPSFEGGHAVCVIPLGAGRIRWLDPLAPMGYGGDETNVVTALTFAWIPSDAREALAGEFTTVEDQRVNIVKDIVRFEAPRHWKAKKTAIINGYDGTSKTAKVSREIATGSGAEATALVEINGDNIPLQKDGSPYRYVETINGVFAGLYVPHHAVEIDESPAQSDCTAEKQQAANAERLRWQAIAAWRAAAPPLPE
jgi:hypothetical protein